MNWATTRPGSRRSGNGSKCTLMPRNGCSTKDAIRDHDDIRDGIRRARQHPVGSADWWRAVRDTRIANSDHMAEEEREALADFRQHAGWPARHDLGIEFAVYEAAHASGVPLTDRDPDGYVRDHMR
jgi:hypothetical protein